MEIKTVRFLNFGEGVVEAIRKASAVLDIKEIPWRKIFAALYL
jgi:hypothetical protein